MGAATTAATNGISDATLFNCWVVGRVIHLSSMAPPPTARLRTLTLSCTVSLNSFSISLFHPFLLYSLFGVSTLYHVAFIFQLNFL